MVGTLYRDLDPNEQEIRLLRILPGEDGSPLRCTLEETSPQNSEFDALSYCWGSSETPATIDLNGTTMAITASLHEALHHFRRVGVGMEQPLWVDALCINQKNTAERSSQVSLMGELYRCATRVHIWLGGPTSITSAAMAAFKELVHLARRPLEPGETNNKFPLPTDDQGLQKLQDLMSFANNPYWKRTWILQEIAFEPDCIIHGHNEVIRVCQEHPDNYSRICSLFEPFGHINVEMREDSNDTQETVQLGIAIEAALHPVRTTGFVGIIRPISHEPSYVRLLTNICLEYRIMLASDPRDKVYGILGLLPTALEITPDYTKSLQQVYTELTQEIIRATQSFAILVDACSGVSDLQSWVPDLRTPCKFPTPFTKQLVSHNMSANLPAVASVSALGVLATKGLVIDSVKEIRAGSDGILTIDDLRNRVSEWRTLFEDTVSPSHGRDRDMDLNNAFWNAIMTADEDVVGFDTTQVHDYTELLLSSQIDSLAPARDSIKTSLLNVMRRYDMFSTSHGHLGHAPRGHVSTGDSLLLLAGAPAPFCVAPLENNKHHYVLKAPVNLMPIDTDPDYIDYPGGTQGTVGRFRAKHPVMDGTYLVERAGLESVIDAQEEAGREAVMDLMHDVWIE